MIADMPLLRDRNTAQCNFQALAMNRANLDLGSATDTL